MNQTIAISELKPEDIHQNQITLKLNLKFQHDNAMFRIESLNSELAECVTIQSKNKMHRKSSKFKFDDLMCIKM